MKYVIGIVAAILVGSTAWGGKPAPFHYAHEAVVAVVKDVPVGDWTYGNPPRVTVEVQDVLRGQAKKGPLKVVWGPPPNGYDTDGHDQQIRLWNATKMEGPKEGTKWIIAGWMTDGALSSGEGDRFAWNEESLAFVTEAFARTDEMVRREMARREEYNRQLAAKRAAWRATTTDKEIERMVAEADFVGLVTRGFEVEEIFKGKRRYRYTNNQYFVSMNVPDDLKELLTNGKYVVFLSERGAVLKPSVIAYQPVGAGLVIADDAAVNAARAAAKRTPAARRPTVLLYGFDWDLPTQAALQIPEATVIAGLYRGIFGPTEVDKLPIDGVDYVLSVVEEPGSEDMLRAVGLEVAAKSIVVDERWRAEGKKQTVQRMKELVAKVAARARPAK